ncbi:MAG: glycosyltransferase family 4 protein [Rubrivivax sp.]|nr:glycosyltransferase family 4 protein [Rubrivivax sp.]
MKVAYVTQPYDGVLPPRQNSIGLIVYNTAMQVARSAEVTLYLRQVEGNVAAAGSPLRVQHTRSASDEFLETLAARYPRWVRRLGLSARADAYLGWASAVASGLRRAPVDVVHVMNYWGWSQRLRGSKLVLEMQSEWLSQLDRRAVSEQLREVAAVVAVSGHVERLFKAAFPDFRGEVAVAHNGVDTDLFCPPASPRAQDEGSPRIVFVGRMSPEKGLHTLIPAFARLAAQFPGATLELVGPRTVLPRRFLVDLSDDPLVSALTRFYRDDGSSDYQQHLDGLVRDHGLGDRVRFHGSLPHADIVRHYQQADLVVNPSLSETFGISIVEGMACGVPVVGTLVGGMLDTITDDVGLAVPAEDAEALAAAMGDILRNRERANALGRRGRERAVKHFTWSARAERLLDVYRRVSQKP